MTQDAKQVRLEIHDNGQGPYSLYGISVVALGVIAESQQGESALPPDRGKRYFIETVLASHSTQFQNL
jgi:hypothetical protein